MTNAITFLIVTLPVWLALAGAVYEVKREKTNPMRSK
jgi:hypothetical protein